MTNFKRDLIVEPAHGPGWVVCRPCPKRPVQKADGSWCSIDRVVECFAPTKIAALAEMIRRQTILDGVAVWRREARRWQREGLR